MEERGSPCLARLLVEAAAPTRASIHPCERSDCGTLGEGQVHVHISKLVVTANALTYALYGNVPVLKYFDHFPVPGTVPHASKYGSPPCWGTGIVTESRHPEVHVGAKIHGLFPMAPFVILAPKRVSATEFRDAMHHRKHLIPAYLTYTFLSAPMYRGLSADKIDWQIGAGGLFATGWSMAYTAALHPAKPTALILTSASSRTARGAAFAAKFHQLELEVIGITSRNNLSYAESHGTYDRLCLYDAVHSLPKQQVAVLDVAGSAETTEAIYRHFGDSIVYFGSVGMSHMEARQASLVGLGGVAPDQFLVFAAIKQIADRQGKQTMQHLLSEATSAYREECVSSFKAVRKYGAEGTLEVFNDMLRNTASPEYTYVCSLWPQHLCEPTATSSKL